MSESGRPTRTRSGTGWSDIPIAEAGDAAAQQTSGSQREAQRSAPRRGKSAVFGTADSSRKVMIFASKSNGMTTCRNDHANATIATASAVLRQRTWKRGAR